MNRLARIGYALVASIALAVGTTACTDKRTEFSPVETLTIRLHALGYVRTLEHFRYTVSYKAVPPDKIMVTMRIPPDMSPTLASRVAESAKAAVRRMAMEQFKIENLDVGIDLGILTPDEIQRINHADATSQE